MQQIDITKLSLVELKAYAYEQVLSIDKSKEALSILQNQIKVLESKSTEVSATEEVKVDESTLFSTETHD